MYDVLIIGGGVSGMSCALLLGSAQHKPFAVDKKILLYKMLYSIMHTEYRPENWVRIY
jgi:2-polyprenyl-6-methoxyphenol hydroxylase-like FAD-dependent oxidoreductase